MKMWNEHGFDWEGNFTAVIFSSRMVMDWHAISRLDYTCNLAKFVVGEIFYIMEDNMYAFALYTAK